MAKFTIPKKFEKEKDVKQAVKAILDASGWFWWMPQNMGMGENGTADFCALHPGGVFLAVETKFGKNEPTPLQKGFLETITAYNSFAFVVNETNVLSLKAWTEAFERAVAAQQRKEDVSEEDGAIMLNAVAEMTKFLPTPT